MHPMSQWMSRSRLGIISFKYEISHFRMEVQHLERDSLYGKLWIGGPDLTLGKMLTLWLSWRFNSCHENIKLRRQHLAVRQ